MQAYQTQPDERPGEPKTSVEVGAFLGSETLGSFPISAYMNSAGLSLDEDAYLLDARTSGNYHLSVLPDLGVLDGALVLETVVSASVYEIWWYGTANAPTEYYLAYVDAVDLKIDTIALGLAAQAGWGVTTDPNFVDINLQSEGARALNQNQYASGMFVIDVVGGAVDYNLNGHGISQSDAGRYLLTHDNPTGQRNSMWGPLWIDQIQRSDTQDEVTDWAMSVNVNAVSLDVPKALRPFTPDWGSPGQVTSFSFEVDDSQVFSDDYGNVLANTRARLIDILAVVVEPVVIDKVIDLFAGGPYGAVALTNLNAARETVSFTGGLRERVESILDRLLSADDLPGAEAAVGKFNDWLRGELTSRVGSDAASHYTGMSFGLSETQSSAFSFGIGSLSGYVHSDLLVGSDGPEVLYGNGGDDTIDGGAGIDTSVYSGARASFVLTNTGGHFKLTDTQGTEGTDTLTNIERLQFADQKLALDLSPAAHAGQALEFVGLIAPTLIGAPAVVGLILGLFDQGSSLHDVCQLALDVGLVSSIAGSSTNSALAAMAFRNVIGAEADAGTVDVLVGYMDGRVSSLSQADFMTAIAGLEFNQTHINLVGLQQTGVEYI